MKQTKKQFINELVDTHQKTTKLKASEFEFKQATVRQQNREEYRVIVEDLPVLVCRYDTKHIIHFVNKTYCQYFGKRKEDLIGYDFLRLIPEDSRKQVWENITSLTVENPILTHEHKVISPDGEIRWQRWTDRALFDEKSNLFGYQSIGEDITEHKQAENALRNSQLQLQSIIDNTTAVIYVKDLDGQYILINRQFERLFHITRKSIIGKTDHDIFSEEMADAFRDNDLKVIESKTPIEFEEIAPHDDGNHIYISLKFPIFDSHNTLYGMCGISTDITERKQMEMELLKVDKIESIGILAGGIAHDFNNILTAILGNISLAKMYAKPEDKIFERLVVAEKASLRARDLTQQLLTFSKGGVPVRKTIALTRLLRDSASFSLRGSNVRCKLSIPDDLWHVEVDAGQINQVINNLIINADQAMPEGGTIHMMAENVALSDQYVLPLAGGNYIKISIEDQGVGIPKEHLSKIFDPYYSTKHKGSGLGLAISFSIIKNHDGYIGVASQLGIGTTFYIYLPASQKEILMTQDDEESPIVTMGRVLIMDDEDCVRDVAGEMLKSIGYEVEFARDGDEAIGLYKKAKEKGQNFDAVILDLTVPGGMGGKEAIRKLIEIDPNVKAIVSSGYSTDPVMADYRQYGFKNIVAKPYKLKEFSKILQKVIMERNE